MTLGTKRENERHSLGFEVEISTISGTATNPIEKTILRDISGSGASFLSNKSASYSIGQKIILVIHMPGTQKTDARMQGHATIAWISQAKENEAGAQQASIGVSMDSLLSFQQSPMDTDKPESAA